MPEYILINVRVPTKGSVATLNAKAEKDSLSSNFLSISSLESGLVPLIEPISMGLGKKSTTASNKGCTPLFLKADPVNTGTKSNFKQPFLTQDIRSASVIVFPFK